MAYNAFIAYNASSQTVKQIEVVKEGVSPQVSKLNSPVRTKNQGDQEPRRPSTVRKRKKDCKKRKMDFLLFLYID